MLYICFINNNKTKNKMKTKTFNTAQKVTIVIFLILGTILVINQYINNFNFVI